MSKVFYRYIRPLKFNEKRTEVETFPRGGICLRFERTEADPNMVTVTHSRCHEDELFSKGVARLIADARAVRAAHIVNPPLIEATHETAVLVERVIDACLNWYPTDGAVEHFVDDMAAKYTQLELHELASALERMMHANYQADMRCEVWRLGFKAAGFADQYSDYA